MTGHQHYREAELLLREAYAPSTTHATRATMIATAQVHATLADAAATASAHCKMMPTEDREGWLGATG